jgi:hypothetical protein
LNFLGTIKKYTIGLPSLIYWVLLIRKILHYLNQKFIQLARRIKSLFDIIEDALSLSINDKEGFITISFTDNNKNVAAQITQIAQNLLQEKIIEFKNKSSKEMLDFALKQYSEKKNLMKNYKMKELFLLIRILIFQAHCFKIN